MSPYDTMFDLKINIGNCDFALYSFKTIHWLGTSQYDPTADLKIFIGHYALYFMVQ